MSIGSSSAVAGRGTAWRVGAGVLVAAPVLYVAGEGVAAAAWTSPSYSYASNYISDLGVPEAGEFQGRVIDSPLHLLMNTGFVVHGVLFLVGAVLLRRLLTGAGARRGLVGLAALHAVGIALVGIFHGSAAAVEDGTAALHGAGALLAVVGGNAALVLVGAALRRGAVRVPGGGAAPPRTGTVLVALGVVGVVAFAVLLGISGSAVDGVVERLAVYTIMAGELVAGSSLVARGARRRTAA